MDAFGCTSRGQAHRAGLWLIKTELLETQTVDFNYWVRRRAGSSDVIEVCDEVMRHQARAGGFCR